MNHKSRKVANRPANRSAARGASFAAAAVDLQSARKTARAQRYTLPANNLGMTDSEYQRYLKTCEESHDIMMQVFTLYTQHPDAFYVI